MSDGPPVRPTALHGYSALVAGMAAGFCEEVLFRGLVMSEHAEAGGLVYR